MSFIEFFHENRPDRRFTQTPQQVAQAFLDSRYAEHNWPMERAILCFVADPKGLNATWEPRSRYKGARETNLDAVRHAIKQLTKEE